MSDVVAVKFDLRAVTIVVDGFLTTTAVWRERMCISEDIM
jgi:hypothetical protein